MVQLSLANSRMKDFYDIWLLSTLFSFEGNVLHTAIKNTFNRRKTSLPDAIPFAFTSNFYEDPQKQVQWNAFIRKAKPNVQVDNLSTVIGEVSRFLLPVLDSFQFDSNFKSKWFPEQGWSQNK